MLTFVNFSILVARKLEKRLTLPNERAHQDKHAFRRMENYLSKFDFQKNINLVSKLLIVIINGQRKYV